MMERIPKQPLLGRKVRCLVGHIDSVTKGEIYFVKRLEILKNWDEVCIVDDGGDERNWGYDFFIRHFEVIDEEENVPNINTAIESNKMAERVLNLSLSIFVGKVRPNDYSDVHKVIMTTVKREFPNLFQEEEE